ncbi:MAG: YifB family Mg chelatase-like AAA ATPase [Chthoniobacterales bacterium]
MLTKVYSAALHGADALEVEIEVNEGSGDPKVVIVGLPDAAVKESKDRVTTAMANSGYRWPRGRTTINLAPADIKKEGPSFDLPIAIGMLAIAQGRELSRLRDCCIAGELALTGAIRSIKGVLPIALEARRRGKKALVVPEMNASEASVVQGISVHGVRNLRECFEFLDGAKEIPATVSDLDTVFRRHQQSEVDLADVKGQSGVKRAFEVAVAGGHNLLVIGAPGAGKSMLAKRIPTIMPPMTLEEAIETTKIHSVCGLLEGSHNFVAIRPFRSPHHTISDVGLLGGSTNPTPGEVSLAHHGVLFLDELPEFRRSTLEVLRQPLEDGRVTISRAAGSLTFPADIMLVAAMNPCPCGFYGHPKRECRCSPGQIERYRQRVSGPLLDRIDIHVEAPPVEYDELTSKAPAESSASVRARIEAVRQRQARRFGGSLKPALNARMQPRHMREHCGISEACHSMMKHALDDLHLSARAHDRILKVARTIADLADSANIEEDHLMEAIQYRTLDRSLWM